jgi:hypothetical protein
MNRFKYALGHRDPPLQKMDPELERKLRVGAAQWMLDNLPSAQYMEKKRILEIKAGKAHRIATRIFPAGESEECVKTAADFMNLDEDKLDKIIALFKSGK